jgi:type II secretory pathway pseudopilin PulG
MSTGQSTPLPSRAHEAAFSVVETLVGMTLMFVGLLSLASSTVTGMATKETNRETACATSAARQFLEGMQLADVAFEDLFTAYTTDPSASIDGDDPRLLTVSSSLLRKATRGLFEGVSGTLQPILAPTFDVVGLEPKAGQARDSIGTVTFPVAQGEGGLQLREDIAGRDLNGDGLIDSENHRGDYRILPVTVTVEWKGTRGTRRLEIQSLLVRR